MEELFMLTENINKIYQSIQKNRPLVHCICNAVTINDCANILLAAGARPTMACHIQEVAEITEGCQSLTCNLGATKDYEAMRVAIKAANQFGHPVVIDPVGVSGSTYRRQYLEELLTTTKVTCLRGNASELQAIYEQRKTATGVDAVEDTQLTPEQIRQAHIELAKGISHKYQCITCISGATDIVTDGRKVYQIENGDPMMSRITGSGCMSTALAGAFLAESKEPLLAIVATTVIMGICGELAAEHCREVKGGTMTFRQCMIDELSSISPEYICNRAQIVFD